jgi:hypothetical protein
VAFEPQSIAEDTCAEGHLDADPMYDVLLEIQRAQVTGRLTVEDAAGENHMFFMQGQPVGVQLAEFIHPLGQMLLELGRVDGLGYVRAQKQIWAQKRLAGQVFKELGFLDEEGLKSVLGIQARRKAEYFCRFGSRPFNFCRGLSYLSGFSATPLNIHMVVYLAVSQQMGPQSREAWIENARSREVLLKGTAEHLLPAPLEAYGFGPPEERFLRRIVSSFQHVEDLAETGTLPRDEMAVLLRYLQLSERLEIRDRAGKAPAPAFDSTEDDVFSSSKAQPRAPREVTDPGSPPPASDIHSVPTQLPPQAAAPPTPPAAAPRPVSKPAPKAPAKPPPKPAAKPPAPAAEKPAAPPAAGANAPPMKSLLFPSEDTLKAPDPPKKKKKKKRRDVPLPSEATSATSETKREKTNVGPMPSIVVDFGDDS